MLLGHPRENSPTNCRTSRSAPHLIPTFPADAATSTRTPMTPQQIMMSYARMSYRYTTVTLLSMRPPPEITVFPEHLVERRFLDEENYIDLDRMLAEKAGKFQIDSYGMRDGAGDGPATLSKSPKYDGADPVVTQKVKNRRPKDPLTPHQVAALTSVVTRHQSSTLPTPLLNSQHASFAHGWKDDFNHRPTHSPRSSHRHPHPPQARRTVNPSQTCPSDIKPLLPDYRAQSSQQTGTTPILQRLLQAQQQYHNQSDVRRQHSSSFVHRPTYSTEHHYQGYSALCTPPSPPPPQANSSSTFAWPFTVNPSQKYATHPMHVAMAAHTTVKQNQDVLTQLITDQLRCSTTIHTPSTPGVDLSGLDMSNRESVDDDEEQDFYSAPPSPTQEHEPPPSLFNKSDNPEHARIYNQAVLLNSLIRNMVNESGVQNSSSNESCSSNDTQSTNWNRDRPESYTDMYNLIRLLAPGVKSVAQQELLQYLERGCLDEREEMLRLVRALSNEEQNLLKPVLLRLINEQLEIMKKQQDAQLGHLAPTHQRYSQDPRSSLENWFGSEIYKNAYPRMPSGRVMSAHDLETSRLGQHH